MNKTTTNIRMSNVDNNPNNDTLSITNSNNNNNNINISHISYYNNDNHTIPQVFDGYEWITIQQENDDENENEDLQIPIPPITNDNDNNNESTIFISIASYRDGERCGATLKSIYENAINPSRIFIGLAEQNAPEDIFCLEAYCKYYNNNNNNSIYQRRTIRKDMIQIMENQTYNNDNTNNDNECPYMNNIRIIRVHDYRSYGPIYTRSLIRKVLGNEDYCLQIDSHSIFINEWDNIIINEWLLIQNEFSILTNVPHSIDEQHLYNKDGIYQSYIPRQCLIQFHSEYHYPDYQNPVDGMVRNLKKPLLSHGWSSGFSFGKCHMEESVPYDNQLLYTIPMIEQFSKYVRYFTRGYDTYTPTINIIFHNDTINHINYPNYNHHFSDWYQEKQKQQKDIYRKESIKRIKIPLKIPLDNNGNSNNIIPSDTLHANLGIYGLGKRRTIEQLNEFMNINIEKGIGNTASSTNKNDENNNRTGTMCTGHQWVPYDMSISPIEQLYNNPNNLDPQPEFPMRTQMIYYQQVQMNDHPTILFEEDNNITSTNGSNYDSGIDRSLLLLYDQGEQQQQGGQQQLDSSSSRQQDNNKNELMMMKPLEDNIELPSIYILFFFWIIGLSVWYRMFSSLPTSTHHNRVTKSQQYHHHHKKESDEGLDKEV